MKLKEKLKQYIDPQIDVIHLEKIADDYAIEFAEWCAFYICKSKNVLGDMLHAKSKYDDMYTSKELLEIYKKEKGL